MHIYIYIHIMHDYTWLFYLYKYRLDHFIYIYQTGNIHALHDITVHFIPLRCIELQYITLHCIHSIHILLDNIVCWGEARQELGEDRCDVSACLCQHFNFLRRIKSPCTISYPGFRALGSKKRGSCFFWWLAKMN